tara:strand:+ start:20693 stop:21685 length:993 start_codon:yes stop_codon:yes gene_type:complete
MEIDFVVSWVDMDDPKWKEEFSQYSGKIDNTVNELSEARFRDYGFLKYWFRGVEKFAPWVRKIHFVTCGQKPEWLDDTNPKINLVNHSDYIPNKYLPIFNSSLIEIHLHRIPDLAEHFVYFNDDFYITNKLKPERFFTNGLPNDIAAFRHNLGLSLWNKCLKNNIRVINSKFNKKEVLKRDAEKWYHPSYGSRGRLAKLLKWYPKFITLRTPHNAQPYLKETFKEVWEYAGDELWEVSKNRFRNKRDFTQELFRTWQICQSNFMPHNTYNDTKMFPLLIKSKQAIEAVKNQSYSLVCLNDNSNVRNYEQVIKELDNSFETILPEKSDFEL